MSSVLRLEGCHATVLLLSAGKATAGASLSFLCQCLEEFLHSCRCSSKAGLASSHVAIISDSMIHSYLLKEENLWFGQWHCVVTQVPKTPLHGKAGKTGREKQLSSHENFTPVENVIKILASAVASCVASEKEGQRSCNSADSWSDLATQIHSLLDKAPWKPSDYTVLDVHWLIPGPGVCSPSSAVALYGALKRMREWHKAHIQMVCGSNLASPQLQEWREALDITVVGSPTGWSISPGVIWRGALHFTEHKMTLAGGVSSPKLSDFYESYSCPFVDDLSTVVNRLDNQFWVPKQGKSRHVVFPGFTLTVEPEPMEGGNMDNSNMIALLEAVGLEAGSSFHPSHLEVLQVIDTASLPLFWRSPLMCSLSVSNSSCPSSVALVRELKSHKSAGFLVRLCLAEQLVEPPAAQGRTTLDWLAYIQSKEDGTHQTGSPSPLASYEPGPVLLFCPDLNSSQSCCRTWSCDAWFLWKPEAITSRVFAHSQSIQIAYDDGNDLSISDICMDLPTIDLTADPNKDYCGISMEDFWYQLSKFPCELDLPPSESPEIRALQAHEWIQRKLIRRLATPDLMFGHMVAPPPSTTKDSVGISDMLSYFHETGSPARSDLSPIAMNDPSRVVRILDPADMNVSYATILASTPSSKRQYHGVSYCLSVSDSSLDARLSRIQQRYLVSERASNCGAVDALPTDRRHKKKLSQVLQCSQVGEEGKEKAEIPQNATTSTDPALSMKHKARSFPPRKQTPRKLQPFSSTRSPVIKLSRVKQPARSGVVVKRGRTGKKALVGRKRKGDSSCEMSPYTVNELSMPAKNEHLLKSSSGSGNTDMDARKSTCQPTHPQAEENPTSSNTRVEELSQELVSATSDDVGLGEPNLAADQPCCEEVNPIMVSSVVEKPFSLGKLLTQSEIQTRSVRRSPRKNKWKLEETSVTDRGESAASAGGTSLDEDERGPGVLRREKRSQRHKKRLEQVIVLALKRNNLRHSHPCFRKCYTRLFNLSKSFLKDLRTSKGLTQEMESVVEMNVSQVIAFELRQAGLPSQ